MRFDSYSFFIFLGVVLALYYGISGWRARKGVLLLFSYLFYSIWNPPFVLLLILSTFLDWYFARGAYLLTTRRGRLACMWGSVGVNLGLLGFFKYGGFLVENFQALTALLGFEFIPAAPSIILPVGISFYTFQTLSYTIDAYHRKIKPADSFLDYALYVSFFPQLVAGPIVRSNTFLPQCIEAKCFKIDDLAWGAALLVIGLFQKNVLADALLGPVAEEVFATSGAVNMMAAWGGVLAFAGQIFCDFAGYSTCAIGVARMLGFQIPLNFRHPYAAVGFSDFWKRWHISLSSWLRDYLYIPLGGNRISIGRTQVNLMGTMLIGGLWHGASWTFVIWGGLHGLYLVVERWLVVRFGHLSLWKNPPVRVLLAMVTFALLCLTWVFFRANSFQQAFHLCSSMFGLGEETWSLSLRSSGIAFGLMALIFAVHGLNRNSSIEHRLLTLPWWASGLIGGGMLYLMATLSGVDQAFIYFQF